MDSLDAILSAHDLIAMLRREVPVRLIDISSSGCLLESAARLDVGTTGTLRVVHDADEYFDDIRVMRLQSFPGSSSLYHAGAEFLWTTSPRDHSLRRIVAALQGSAVRMGRFE